MYGNWDTKYIGVLILLKHLPLLCCPVGNYTLFRTKQGQIIFWWSTSGAPHIGQPATHISGCNLLAGSVNEPVINIHLKSQWKRLKIANNVYRAWTKHLLTDFVLTKTKFTTLIRQKKIITINRGKSKKIKEVKIRTKRCANVQHFSPVFVHNATFPNLIFYQHWTVFFKNIVSYCLMQNFLQSSTESAQFGKKMEFAEKWL